MLNHQPYFEVYDLMDYDGFVSYKQTAFCFTRQLIGYSLGMQRYHFFRSDPENSEYRPIPIRAQVFFFFFFLSM